jgi:hypothetical protein
LLLAGIAMIRSPSAKDAPMDASKAKDATPLRKEVVLILVMLVPL